MKRILLIAAIAAAPQLVLLALGADRLWFYVAAAMMLLYLKGREKLGLALLAGILISIAALKWAIWLEPHTYDALLWRLDGCLGFDPSTYAIAALNSSAVLYAIAKQVYFGFPLEIAAAFVWGKDANRFALKLLTACVLGYLIQLLLPACGPAYFLNGTTQQEPRNAMPSLHLTWALLIWQELRERNLAWRVAADALVIFTAVATIGSGEHYVIDLLAAIPFWLAIESLWQQRIIGLRDVVPQEVEAECPRS